MHVSTKYDINEEVFVIRGSSVIKVHVYKIEICIGITNMNVDYSCRESSNHLSSHYKETELFNTKKEAAEEVMRKLGFKCGLKEINE